ncbi:phosphotyrosine-specific ptp2-like protein [Dispira simplex]|nr:phosphotyrosine-specific ptp2-like protein [Dispira simplex]
MAQVPTLAHQRDQHGSPDDGHGSLPSETEIDDCRSVPPNSSPMDVCNPRSYHESIALIQKSLGQPAMAPPLTTSLSVRDTRVRRECVSDLVSTGSFSFPSFTPSTLAQLLGPSRPRASSVSLSIAPVTKVSSDSASRSSDPVTTPRVLLLDIRIPSQFTQSHIADAVNLSVPSTLLKRAGYTVDRVASMLSHPEDQRKLLAWATYTHVVIMDHNSHTLTEQSVITNLCQKFTDPASTVHIGWLRGGFEAFRARFPATCVSSHPESSARIPNSGSAVKNQPYRSAEQQPLDQLLNSVKRSNNNVLGPLTCPVSVNEDPMRNPFFLSFCHNNEPPIWTNSDQARNVGVRLAPHRRRRVTHKPVDVLEVRRMPLYLHHASDPVQSSAYIRQQFEQLQARENARLASVLANAQHHGPSTAPSFSQAIERHDKNRYYNILPFDHNRVPLHCRDPYSDKDLLATQYINASFLHCAYSSRRYIATQGPLPGTIDDFWAMVWEQQSCLVIMLTREEERSRIACHRYWPSPYHTPMLAGREFTVTNIFESVFPADPAIIMRLLRLENIHNGQWERRIIVQLQYTGWPDFEAPPDPRGVLRLRDITNAMEHTLKTYNGPGTDGRDITSHPNLPSDSPVIVHCSAGCGRTGTFCVIDSLLNSFEQSESTTKGEERATPLIRHDIAVNYSDTHPDPVGGFPLSLSSRTVYGTSNSGDQETRDLVSHTVEQFRTMRNYMVQTVDQLSFCYEALVWDFLQDYDRRATLLTLETVTKELTIVIKNEIRKPPTSPFPPQAKSLSTLARQQDAAQLSYKESNSLQYGTLSQTPSGKLLKGGHSFPEKSLVSGPLTSSIAAGLWSLCTPRLSISQLDHGPIVPTREDSPDVTMKVQHPKEVSPPGKEGTLVSPNTPSALGLVGHHGKQDTGGTTTTPVTTPGKGLRSQTISYFTQPFTLSTTTTSGASWGHETTPLVAGSTGMLAVTAAGTHGHTGCVAPSPLSKVAYLHHNTTLEFSSASSSLSMSDQSMPVEDLVTPNHTISSAPTMTSDLSCQMMDVEPSCDDGRDATGLLYGVQVSNGNVREIQPRARDVSSLGLSLLDVRVPLGAPLSAPLSESRKAQPDGLLSGPLSCRVEGRMGAVGVLPAGDDYFSFPTEPLRKARQIISHRIVTSPPRLFHASASVTTSAISPDTKGGILVTHDSGLFSEIPITRDRVTNGNGSPFGGHPFLTTALSPSLSEALLGYGSNISSPLSSPNC